MMIFLEKIWIYGGWFYLSLFLACLSGLIWKKIKPKISLLFSLIVLSFNFYLFFQKSWSLPDDWQAFCQPQKEKLSQSTLDQEDFANQLLLILPTQSQGCIYWSQDIVTQYLMQKLYPRNLRIINNNESASFTDCEFIISQLKPRETENYQEILEFKDNYLYWRQ